MDKNGQVSKKISGWTVLFISFLAIFVSLVFGQAKKSVKDLPDRFRKWITEEVVYIISPKERDVFLQLESDRQRDIFIEAFWKQRDPTPGTPENEFKKDHYRRIAYANQWFGRDSPAPGWRTDMGRIHIILGEPKTIDKFEALAQVFPMQIWFYEGMAKFGLPNAFNVVFYKKEGMGEYVLYTPVKDGPLRLLINYQGDELNYQAAYAELYSVEPTIANVSLSLIPGDSAGLSSPSIASDVLILAKVPAAPFEGIKSDYAEKLLKYKDVIDVDYTANYIDSEAVVGVFEDRMGTSFVHFSIEPKRLTFDQVRSGYHTDLEINGKVADAQGATIYQFDRKVPVDITPDQMEKIKAKLFSYQDVFPLVPGRYKFDLMLKNTVSKEFSSVEADILVPEPKQLSMTSPLLANRIDRESKYRGSVKPFLLGDIQFVPSPRNDFLPDDTLYVYFQLHGLPEAIKSRGIVEYAVLKDGQKVLTKTKPIKDSQGGTDFLEEFPLAGLTAAYYELKLSLRDQNGQEILGAQAQFYITPSPVLPRPWVLSLPQPSPADPYYADVLGTQYLQKKDLGQAKSLIEQAYLKNPGNPKYVLDFCQALFLVKDYKGVKQASLPFLKGEQRYDFLQLVGDASKALEEFTEAIAYYKDYLAHFGTNIVVLNSVGECYHKLGNVAEALVAWERSLQLNPNQADIASLVKSLKEKK
jgi:GWxTD domain-containing protein